ncbi:hypothetical protein H4R18_005900 [Coemansia javaensis]|uniref:Pentatricopeptide repeat-containing protein n=1 Tax=Coemansia javaensis TaxID=2761396 RepID=A0A9W8LEP2_9FUNG|nr:hypothetical protein H4R18_005900 [Coemansia javaensis]
MLARWLGRRPASRCLAGVPGRSSSIGIGIGIGSAGPIRPTGTLGGPAAEAPAPAEGHHHRRGSSIAQLRRALAEIPRAAGQDQPWQALSHYTRCLRLSAAPALARRRGLYAEDHPATQRLGRELARASGAVGAAVGAYAARCVRRGDHAQAVAALARALAADRAHDAAFLLSTAAAGALLAAAEAQAPAPADGARALARANAALLDAAGGAPPEPAVRAAVARLVRRGCFRDAALWAPRLTRANASAAVAALVLRALREEQRLDHVPRPPTTARRRALTPAEAERAAAACRFAQQARHVIRALAAAGAVGAGHLAKLVEIELASAPPGRRLPRDPALWLREFGRWGVAPGARALVAIANAYRARGDPLLARRVLARAAGAQGPAVAARALDDLRASGRTPPASLVACAVAWAVDWGSMADAERLWRDYGCAAPRANAKALAKLVQGYARAGCVDKAVAFLHTACALHDAPGDAPHYLTGLLNAVLRCAVRDQSAASGWSAVRRDLDLLRLAERHAIPLDAATHNVLLAALSRAAHAHIANAPLLAAVARAMDALYARMRRHGVAPDDSTVVHLLPLWVFSGRVDAAQALWRECVAARPRHKALQISTHVLAQARRWGVADQVRTWILSLQPLD